jgi:hypothetical protein
MAIAAEFVARHVVDAGAAEGGANFGDEAGNHHGVHVGRGKQEAVDDIGAAEAEFHRRIDGNPRTIRNESVLFGDQSHRDRSVGLDGCAKIALGELAAEMQGHRVDRLHIARRMKRTADAGHHNNRHHHS